MDKILAIVCISCCISCGTFGHQPVLQISGFETQVAAFEQAAAIVGYNGYNIPVTDLTITLNSSIGSLGEAGVCFPGSQDRSPAIEINTQLWSRYSDTEKEVILFHELGHCILGRQHKNTFDTNGMPVSVMYYSISVYDPVVVQGYYESNRLDYIHELFQR